MALAQILSGITYLNEIGEVCHNHVVKVLYGMFYRCLSPKTQRGVCEGGGVGVAALSSHKAPAEADLDQSHPPREAPGSA